MCTAARHNNSCQLSRLPVGWPVEGCDVLAEVCSGARQLQKTAGVLGQTMGTTRHGTFYMLLTGASWNSSIQPAQACGQLKTITSAHRCNLNHTSVHSRTSAQRPRRALKERAGGQSADTVGAWTPAPNNAAALQASCCILRPWPAAVEHLPPSTSALPSPRMVQLDILLRHYYGNARPCWENGTER